MSVGISNHTLTVPTITIVPIKVKNMIVTSNMVKGSFLSMTPMSLENLNTKTEESM